MNDVFNWLFNLHSYLPAYLLTVHKKGKVAMKDAFVDRS